MFDPELPHKIIILFIDSISIWLAGLVFLDKPKEKVNRLFTLTTLSLLGWVNFAYMARLMPTFELSVFVLKIAWFVTPPFFVLLYFFSIYLIRKEEEYKRLSSFILGLGAILSLITAFTDLIISGTSTIEGVFTIIYGQAMLPYLAAVAIIMIATLVPVFKNYFLLRDNLEKKKLRFYLLGLAIFYGMNLVFNIALPIFGGIARYYFFGDYSTIVILVFIAYAIIKHELFEIKVLLSTLFVSLIGVLLLLDIIVFTDNRSFQSIKLISFAFFIYFGFELIKNVLTEIKRREELENLTNQLHARTTDLQTIQEITNYIATTLDLKELAQKFVDSIPEKLGKDFLCGIFMIREEHTYRTVAISQSAKTKLGALSHFCENLLYPTKKISAQSAIIVELIQEKKYYISENFSELVSPPLEETIALDIQKKMGAQSIVLFPVLVGSKVMGIVKFALAIPKNNVQERQLRMMQAFTDQISLAVNNVNMYRDLKRAKENLEQAYQELQKLDTAKMEFVSMTSHQLRTPISVIRGYVSMLEEGEYGKLTEEEISAIHKTKENVARLAEIVDDILSVAHIESGNLSLNIESVDLLEIIQSVIDELKTKAASKGIAIVFNHPPTVPALSLDRHKISQVFINLLDNALVYTPKGTITFDVTTPKSKNIVVTVTDTGIGIPKEYMPVIFGKFTRAQNAKAIRPDGSGIGLFIVKNIIEIHGGTIGVMSQEGKGTTFTITLPIKTAQIKKNISAPSLVRQT